MGSTLQTLLTLLENQINIGVTSSSTEITQTLLTIYINRSIEKIAREIKPRELRNSSAIAIDITSGNNSVSLPSTILVPEYLYFVDSDGKYNSLLQRTLKQIIDLENPQNFFDTSNTGTPSYYAIEGTAITFNKHFDYSGVGSIKLYGLTPPTTLSIASLSGTTELPTLYDLLITYTASVLFYQKDSDVNRLTLFNNLMMTEKNHVMLAINTNTEQIIDLDNNIFASPDGFNRYKTFGLA